MQEEAAKFLSFFTQAITSTAIFILRAPEEEPKIKTENNNPTNLTLNPLDLV